MNEKTIEFESNHRAFVLDLPLALQEEKLIRTNMDEGAEVDLAPEDADNENQADDNEEENNENDDDLSSFFLSAVIAGDLMTTRRLLEGGADKNVTTIWGRTAMWNAARDDHLEIVRLLVEQGADME